MRDDTPLATVLRRYMDERGYSLERLAHGEPCSRCRNCGVSRGPSHHEGDVTVAKVAGCQLFCHPEPLQRGSSHVQLGCFAGAQHGKLDVRRPTISTLTQP